ncbi:hypothetical protein O181_075499 [Austropuccinia psidii MF-1]|uniref:Uncharacterized protein n=1 Tax=Austropuccinia psidii MF-1 TaxID=1389203 RepID=A0A9Q3FAP5_9BASI|nr:hypothetical protein [Austropuccinia psidii MF-1]
MPSLFFSPLPLEVTTKDKEKQQSSPDYSLPITNRLKSSFLLELNVQACSSLAITAMPTSSSCTWNPPLLRQTIKPRGPCLPTLGIQKNNYLKAACTKYRAKTVALPSRNFPTSSYLPFPL